MKKIIVLIVMALAIIFMTAKDMVANPIDRYIGQMRLYKTTVGLKGKYKDKPFFLYPGDRLVIERDNRNGKYWIMGIYYPDLEGSDNEKECVVALKKIEISHLDIVLNVNINEEWLHHCD